MLTESGIVLQMYHRKETVAANLTQTQKMAKPMLDWKVYCTQTNFMKLIRNQFMLQCHPQAVVMILLLLQKRKIKKKATANCNLELELFKNACVRPVSCK